MHKRWKLVSKRLKNFHQCVVLPIGSLSTGLCRHRAILFKVGDFYLVLNSDYFDALGDNCFGKI